MIELEATDDLEIGRKIVREKIERDGISEELLQVIIEKAAASWQKQIQLELSSVYS